MRCQLLTGVRTARRYGKQIFLSVDVREDSGVLLEVEKAVFGTVGDIEREDVRLVLLGYRVESIPSEAGVEL
jgi:hypothetical protein